MIAIISTPEHTTALRERLGADPSVLVFPDTDSLKALETIAAARPTIVAFSPAFTATARGAALVAQLRGDASLSGIDIRVLLEDERQMPLLLADHAGPAEQAVLEASRPLDRAGTRAALRYVMDRRPIIVNGERSLLIDLSTTGAQLLLSVRVRPSEPVRMVLSAEAGDKRLSGAIVWAIAVPIGPSIHYRAGAQFSNPDAKWIEAYCQQYGGRPDRTFGAV